MLDLLRMLPNAKGGYSHANSSASGNFDGRSREVAGLDFRIPQDHPSEPIVTSALVSLQSKISALARDGIIEATMISAPSGPFTQAPVQNSIEFSIGRRVERCGMIAESKAAAALVGGCGGRGSKSHC